MRRIYRLMSRLAVGVLCFCAVIGGVSAAGSVHVGENVTTVVNGNPVTFALDDPVVGRLDVSSTAVGLRGVTFQVSGSDQVNVTMEQLDPDAAQGDSLTTFTAEADAGTMAQFMITGLDPDTQYSVFRDGVKWKEVTTDGSGTLQFSTDDWSRHTFSIIKIGGVDILNVGGETIELELGERRDSHISIQNTRDEQVTYELRVTPNMPDGTLITQLLDDDVPRETVTVDVGAGKTRTVPVRYIAASCSSSPCSGSATFTIRALDTNEFYSATVNVNIVRESSVYGSPGITGLELLVIILAGASLVFIRRSGQ